MKRIVLSLAVVAGLAGVVVAAGHAARRTEEGAAPQPAKEVHVANLYNVVENEPPPKLFVDPPDPKALAQGVVWIQYRVENLRIVPVFGKGALGVSPRVGHLHVHVDDLPWWWADPSNTGTVDIAGMPPGEHKVRIELVDADHQTFPGQSRTVKFTVPATNDWARPKVLLFSSDASKLQASRAMTVPSGYDDVFPSR